MPSELMLPLLWLVTGGAFDESASTGEPDAASAGKSRAVTTVSPAAADLAASPGKSRTGAAAGPVDAARESAAMSCTGAPDWDAAAEADSVSAAMSCTGAPDSVAAAAARVSAAAARMAVPPLG